MNGKILKTTVLWCSVLCLQLLAHSQSEFGDAHTLLQKLTEDRAAARTAAEKERLSKEVGSIPLEVERLLNTGTLKFLNTETAPIPEELRGRLEAALRIGPEELGNSAEAYVVHINMPSAYLVVYNVSYCAACSRSWIGVFAPADGHYKIVASLDDSLPNQSLKAVPLWIGGGVIRFLVYGTNWGDAHSRLNAVAYVFDGHRINSVWSRTGLPQGTVEVKPGTLVLSFLTELRPPWRQRTETYAVTASEIQLERASESPVE